MMSAVIEGSDIYMVIWPMIRQWESISISQDMIAIFYFYTEKILASFQNVHLNAINSIY